LLTSSVQQQALSLLKRWLHVAAANLHKHRIRECPAGLFAAVLPDEVLDHFDRVECGGMGDL
jgi:hypothetical protein